MIEGTGKSLSYVNNWILYSRISFRIVQKKPPQTSSVAKENNKKKIGFAH